ncbi:MAG: phosphoribosyl-ATP diphosphatase [Pseudomonadota bacterium]
MSDERDARILDRLFATVAARKAADPSTSYTAKLLAEGTPKAAQKLGEEAVEVVIEAVRGEPAAVATESADLLYHLCVVWAATGVTPDQVWTELARREGVGGLTEKAARGAGEGEAG